MEDDDAGEGATQKQDARASGIKGGGSKWSTATQMQIGARLAKEYDETVSLTPPDKFRILLDQLNQRARSRAPRKS